MTRQETYEDRQRYDLKTIEAGEDTTLITKFMKKATLSPEAKKVYPYHLRRKYLVGFEGIEDIEPFGFYAIDDEAALEYLAAYYDLENYPLNYFAEAITIIREIDL